MPIRISCEPAEGVTTLRIEGRLLSEDLASLRAECHHHPGSLRLELSDLQFADRESVEALRKLMRERAELVGASPYLELLLHPKPQANGGPPPSRDDGSSKR
jgi:hypothetical protein